MAVPPASANSTRVRSLDSLRQPSAEVLLSRLCGAEGVKGTGGQRLVAKLLTEATYAQGVDALHHVPRIVEVTARVLGDGARMGFGDGARDVGLRLGSTRHAGSRSPRSSATRASSSCLSVAAVGGFSSGISGGVVGIAAPPRGVLAWRLPAAACSRGGEPRGGPARGVLALLAGWPRGVVALPPGWPRGVVESDSESVDGIASFGTAGAPLGGSGR